MVTSKWFVAVYIAALQEVSCVLVRSRLSMSEVYLAAEPNNHPKLNTSSNVNCQATLSDYSMGFQDLHRHMLSSCRADGE